jgi:hypothetical protein
MRGVARQITMMAVALSVSAATPRADAFQAQASR